MNNLFTGYFVIEGLAGLACAFILIRHRRTFFNFTFSPADAIRNRLLRFLKLEYIDSATIERIQSDIRHLDEKYIELANSTKVQNEVTYDQLVDGYDDDSESDNF